MAIDRSGLALFALADAFVSQLLPEDEQLRPRDRFLATVCYFVYCLFGLQDLSRG
jgi:hypothetical protein